MTTNPNMSPFCIGGEGLTSVKLPNEAIHPKYMSSPVPIISARKISSSVSNFRRSFIDFIMLLLNTSLLFVPENLNKKSGYHTVGRY